MRRCESEGSQGLAGRARVGAVLLLLGLTMALVGALAAALAGCPGAGAGVEPQVTLFDHRTGQRQRLGLEKYLEGVVAAEMDPRWPQTALEAQAIVARTFTMDRLSRGGTRRLHGTDLCTDPRHVQAYDAARVTPAVRQAVRATRGQVITHGGRFARAYFHAASGGRTSTPSEGLGLPGVRLPYLVPVEDVATPQNRAAWSASFTKAEVESAAARLGIRLGELEPVGIGRKGPSGRALEVVLGGRRVSAPRLRSILGPTRMRSTLLDEVRLEGDRLVLEGRGYGHGVGMAQWGAYAMARQGKTCTDIIRHYYPGVKLETRWT
ncbi:MAG: SpoIID/LytB domain-containing protein [Acetobacteraceae bacterium]|nr:SpoIID/LytB domain-containing protein [Acetobacteraceae bacterium]